MVTNGQEKLAILTRVFFYEKMFGGFCQVAIRWCFTVVAIRSGIFFNGYCFLILKLLPRAMLFLCYVTVAAIYMFIYRSDNTSKLIIILLLFLCSYILVLIKRSGLEHIPFLIVRSKEQNNHDIYLFYPAAHKDSYARKVSLVNFFMPFL